MKLIKLNESQYNRLFEISQTVASLGVAETPDANPEPTTSEVSPQAEPGEGGVYNDADALQQTQTNNMRWGTRF